MSDVTGVLPARVLPEERRRQRWAGAAGGDPDGGPARGGGPAWRVPAAAVALMVPLYAVWVTLLATGGGDLAAQIAWADFAHRHPGSPYNMAWYGGMHAADYSVLTPLTMAYAGVRTVTTVAGLAATWGMAAVFVRAGVRRPMLPAVVGGLCLWCDVASGRTTFAVGVAFGLAAVWCAQHGVDRRHRWGRHAGTAGFAGLTALSSPVAALFLWVVAGAYLLTRRGGPALALALPPALVMTAVAVLFPFQGEQLMNGQSLVGPLTMSLALIAAAPRQWRAVRLGAALYTLGMLVTAAVDSPVGTNVERLASVAGLPVLAAALYERAAVRRRSRSHPWRSPLGALLVLVVCTGYGAVWLTTKTVSDLRVATPVPGWASHTDGLVDALQRLRADRHRVEVVPARNHREAAVLAGHTVMARGWNRQLDVERDGLFYDPELSPAAYRAWLDHWAVGYVVLPHGRVDGPAKREAAIVRGGQDWLRPVWQDQYWTVLGVADPVPLASAPGSVVRAGQADVVVRMPTAGSTTVRVVHSPWLTADGACVRPDGPWTRITVTAPGDYRIRSSYRRGGHDCH